MDMEKRYFTLTVQSGNPIPQVTGWYGKLDVRKVNREDYRSLPKHLILEMKSGMDVIYPDILTDPVLMVSEGVMEVIRMYDRRMPFFYLVLFDAGKEMCVSYYCPILAEGEEAENEVLYRVKVRERYEIRICEELVESLLDRGAVGLELRECGEREPDAAVTGAAGRPSRNNRY